MDGIGTRSAAPHGRGKHHAHNATIGVSSSSVPGTRLSAPSILLQRVNLGIRRRPLRGLRERRSRTARSEQQPELPGAGGGAGGVQGTFNSTPNGTFTIHYYGNPACDPSGNGEGQTFLGSAQVTTDANGNATIPLFAAAVGTIVTATATARPTTPPEFSACVTVPGGAAVGGPVPRDDRVG